MKDRQELQKTIKSFFDSKEQELIQLGTWFWKNPEPGYREVKTSTKAVECLRNLGLTVQTGLALTGFRAVVDTGKPGPTVGVLGELDSLIIPSHPEADPQTGAVHSCGHNSSLTALIGTAMALTQTDIVKDLCGKIVFIGCPAEEGIEMEYRMGLIRKGQIRSIAGKSELICEGAFQDVDMAFMNHLSVKYGYNDHNGSVNKKITFHGKSCHASTPQRGRNALNAANLALHAIGLLRESYSYTDKIRIHGIISKGGDAVNVIPDTVVMEYMLRGPSVKEIVELNDRFDRIVLHAAMAAECEAETETVNGYMPLYDDPDLGKVLQNAVQTAVPGADFDANGVYYCSCTDVGDVSTIMPAIQGYVPGQCGTSHGNNYGISGPVEAYRISPEVEALMVADLLYGKGEKALKIAEKKKNCMPIPEYIELIKSLNRCMDTRSVSSREC